MNMTYPHPYRVASRFASEIVGVGDTWENESWRIHRYADSVKVTELENAGKRGKTVRQLTVFSPRGSTPWESVTLEFVMHAKRGSSFDRMQQIAQELKETGTAVFEVHTSKGIDVMPAGFKTISIKGKYVWVEAEYRSFQVRNLEDPYNEPTCIPAITGGKASIPMFYRWVKDNGASIAGMTFNEVVEEMRKLGIKYHRYCAMD